MTTSRFMRFTLSATAARALAAAAIATAVPAALAHGSHADGYRHALIQVVGDDACPQYAVDIAAFATCDGDRVAWTETEGELVIHTVPPDTVPARKRTARGSLVSAVEARRILQAWPRDVVLVDIRSRVEAVYVGQPALDHVHVPFLEPAEPLRWNAASSGLEMKRNPNFVQEVRAAVARAGAREDSAILLLCRSGDRSARAADELAAAGLRRVYSIVDGFEGDVGPGGKRDVNGWKNTGSDWVAVPKVSMLYDAQR